MASTAETPTDTQRGVDIMIAGLAFQVAALLLFMVLCLDFARRAYRNRGRWNPAHASLQQTVLWKAFLICEFKSQLIPSISKTKAEK